jgi:AraC family transcriptional regulator
MNDPDLVKLKFKADGAAASRLVLPKASLCAEHVTLPSEAPCEYAVSGRHHYIALHDVVLDDGELLADSDLLSVDKDLRGKVTYIPSGMSVRGWGAPKARRNSFTAIHFGADAIPEPLAQSSVWERARVHFTDGRLGATLVKLDRALHAGEPFMSLLGETLCDLAIVELAHGHQTATSSVRDKPALRPSDIDRVHEFIVAHLADDISLTDLAHVVGLSKYYFCRAYKSATGRSPYHEILATRIETARDFLIRGAPIQKAAAQTGFTNLSQFSRTFKQFTGLSPSAFTRASN